MTLPSALGLTALGDFPSMVTLLVSAYFILRSVTTRAGVDAVAAGLAAGLALTIKPANLLFLPASIVAYAIARRPRALAVFAAALLPGLIGLTIWKYRGLGYLPVFRGARRRSPWSCRCSPSPDSTFTATRSGTGRAPTTTSTASASTPGASGWSTGPGSAA